MMSVPGRRQAVVVLQAGRGLLGRTLLYVLGILLCSALLCIAGYVLGKHFKHYKIYIYIYMYKNIHGIVELMPDADSASINNIN